MSTEERSGRPDDDAIAQAWRRASREEPPAVVDEAILAAARNEAGVARSGTPVAVQRRLPTPRATARAPWWSRWQPLLAAASVAGVAFVLVQRLPPDDVRTTPRADERSREIAGEEATAAAPQPDVAGNVRAPGETDVSGAGPVAPKAGSVEFETPGRAESDASTADVAVPEGAAPEAGAIQVSPAAPTVESARPEPPAAAMQPKLVAPFSGSPAETGDAAAESSATSPGFGSSVPAPPGSDNRASARSSPATTTARPRETAGHAHAESAADATATSDAQEFARQSTGAMQSTEAPVSADEWARRIESLHRAGSISEAAAELRRFRAAHADADRWLAPELRSWAATIGH